MKKIILASLCFSLLGSSSAMAESLKYKVKKGETFYDIAKKYKISLEKLQTSNLKYFQKQLKYGDEIIIPLEEPSVDKRVNLKSANKIQIEQKVTKENEGNKVRVAYGDSLSSFAKRHNVSLEALKTVNPDKVNVQLKYGDELIVPSKNKLIENKIKRELKENKEVEKKKDNKLSTSNNSIIPVAKRKLGTRYVYGAMGPYKFDCSGFTSYVFKAKGVCLPRKASAQYQKGQSVSRNNLKEGDLVFFDTDNRRSCISHVGIYAGNNKFVHASSGARKVVVSNLDKDFYSKRYRGARRYLCN